MKALVPLFLLLAFTSLSVGQLSGPLSGTLGPGLFHVVDTISVEAGDSLMLLPGTTFLFDGPFPFRIYGTLLAEGTETDSIIFTTDTHANPNGWGGIRFSRSYGPDSEIAYCVIEYALMVSNGGAVSCLDSSPIFANCVIRGNSAIIDGGGVYCRINSSPTFTRCVLSHNSANGSGGGVYCQASSPTFTQCVLSHNSTNGCGGGGYCHSSSPTFINCTISHNNAMHGGGMYCGTSSPAFIDCVIRGNHHPPNDHSFTSSGWGMHCWGNSSPVFSGCTIDSNESAHGGAVYCAWNSSPSFTGCMMAANFSAYGGAVCCTTNCSPDFESCTLSGNYAQYFGGGIACYDGSSPTMAHCIIDNNRAEFYWGGGIFCLASSPVFIRCVIRDNSAFGWFENNGGGISVIEHSSPTVTHCTISGNMAYYRGGGVYCWYSTPVFTNCTMYGNAVNYQGGGVYCQSSSPLLANTVIAYSEGEGIHFFESENAQIEYCDIFGNSGSSFGGSIPGELGQMVAMNANGDSCDTYFNIFLDPMFADTATGDFHLLASSPCIDAGDLELPLDPDGTIADIGAYYFDQLDVRAPVVSVPVAYSVYQNWPNPFNSSTMIRYDVPQAGKVRLTISNLLGQKGVTLFDGRQFAGSHTIAWDASNLPSGLCFCRMDAAGFAQTRKMLLVK